MASHIKFEIGDPMDTNKVPTNKKKGNTNVRYDQLMIKIADLAKGKALPVRCLNHRQAINAAEAIKRRDKTLNITIQDNIVYVSKKDSSK